MGRKVLTHVSKKLRVPVCQIRIDEIRKDPCAVFVTYQNGRVGGSVVFISQTLIDNKILKRTSGDAD